MEKMSEETSKYTELVTLTVERLARLWEKGEGTLTIRVTDDKGKHAKIEGGETERI